MKQYHEHLIPSQLNMYDYVLIIDFFFVNHLGAGNYQGLLLKELKSC